MTVCELNEKRCAPCEGGVDKLTTQQIEQFMPEIPEWSLKDDILVRSYKFDDFIQALEFTNRVGALSEEEAHHPEIVLAWGQVDLRIWTHAIDGLSENDFILAAKVDRL